MNTNYAAYVRTSDNREDNERQFRKIKAYCDRKGITIPDDFWFVDEGESRHTSERRPAFQRMLKLIERGVIKVVLVDSLQRFGIKGRDEIGHYRHMFRETWRCKLIDTTRGIDLTSKDIAVKHLTTQEADTSEQFQHDLSHNVLNGKIVSAKAGNPQGGIAPYGYDKEFRNAKGEWYWRIHQLAKNKFVIIYPDGRRETRENQPAPRKMNKEDRIVFIPSEDKTRVEVAVLVFKWYAWEGLTGGMIVRRLNGLGYRYYGNYFHTIHDWLDNDAYRGFLAYYKTGMASFREIVDGEEKEVTDPKPKRRDRKDWVISEEQVAFPPLIDNKTWGKVQERLGEGSRTRPPKNEQLTFKGLLFCAKCGRPMATNVQNGKRQYKCVSYLKWYQTKDPRYNTGCGSHTIDHDVVKQIVDDELNRLQVSFNPHADRETLVTSWLNLIKTQGYYERVLTEGFEYYAERIRQDFGLPEPSFDDLDDWREQHGLDAMPSAELRLSYILSEAVGTDTNMLTDTELIDRIESERVRLAQEKRERLETEYERHYHAKVNAASDRERRMAQREMDRLEQELQGMEEQLTPLNDRLDIITSQLKEQWNRVRRTQALKKEGALRAYTESLRSVFKKVILRFPDYWPKGKKRQKTDVGTDFEYRCTLPDAS